MADQSVSSVQLVRGFKLQLFSWKIYHIRANCKEYNEYLNTFRTYNITTDIEILENLLANGNK